jgi:GNAT superfamily N-acetyltransferase
MEVQQLTFHDRVKIANLLGQRDVFTDEEIQVALDVIDEAFNRPERKDYQVYGAFDGDGNLAGYICFGPIPMTDDCYDLYWIVVDRQFSRKEVGRKLLGFMEKSVTREGARRIYAETSSTPPYKPARSFYEKNGYHVVCGLNDFYREGDHKLIFMKEVFGLST